MKRRIAESLPALFLINRKESKVLIEILRCDWDDIWKSDNRRRTIESFPFLLKKENEFIKENLNVVYNDEIYTLISIVEVIYEWKRKIDKGEAENLFKDFITQVVGYGYSLEDLNTLKAEWNLLELIHTNPVAAVKKYDEIFTNETDYFMLICLARNLLYLCSYYPECKAKSICKGTPHIILKYVDFFLMEENHKNVRRPMAKECILDCLVTILKRREYISAVKGTTWKLIKDKDSIIRRPAFDKIDRICDIDNNFGRSIIDYLRRQEDDIILSDRAKELD